MCAERSTSPQMPTSSPETTGEPHSALPAQPLAAYPGCSVGFNYTLSERDVRFAPMPSAIHPSAHPSSSPSTARSMSTPSATARSACWCTTAVGSPAARHRHPAQDPLQPQIRTPGSTLLSHRTSTRPTSTKSPLSKPRCGAPGPSTARRMSGGTSQSGPTASSRTSPFGGLAM